MSLFRMPVIVQRKLESFMIQFFWRGNSNSRGLCNVAWYDICKPFSQGGLGLVSLKVKNQALLLKWIWNLKNQPPDLWYSIAEASSCISPSNMTNSPFLSSLWRGNSNSRGLCNVAWHDICKPFYQGGLGLVSLKVKNQALLLKWIWKLKNQPSDLWFRIADASSCISTSNLMNSPLLSSLWRGILKGSYWSQDVKDLFLSKLTVSSRDGFDHFLWNGDTFKVSKFISLQYENSSHPFSYDLIWKSLCPPKIKCFLWQALKDSIPTGSFLASRLIIDVSNSACGICGLIEDANHILMHCNVAWRLWCNMLNKAGCSWVMPGSLFSFLEQWPYILSLASNRKLWSLIGYLILWELWKTRNARIFNSHIVDTETLLYSCIARGVFIYKLHKKDFLYSSQDVFRSPACIF